jgi:peroxiredoxin/outer membrane lipoprotein-sorting protein
MSKRKMRVGILMLMLLAVTSARAQTADDIINKYLAATGGEKWKSLETLGVTSRSQAFSFNLYWRKPNRVRKDVLVDSPSGQSSDIRAFDGKTGWRLSPELEGSEKPRLMSEQEVLELLEEGDVFTLLFNYKAKGYKVELPGKESSNGQSVYKLKITKPSGQRVDVFVDDKTSLIVRQAAYGRDPEDRDAVRAVTANVGDYRSVGGLMLPHRIGAAVLEYHVNAAMDENAFKMPGQENQVQESPVASPDKPQDEPIERVRDAETRADLLKLHPEADVNKDGLLSLEEAWAFLKKDQAARKLLVVGTLAPDWVLGDASNKSHQLSDYRGKVVVMDFGAVWCIPCHRAMPWLEKLHTEFSKRGLVVLGISTGEKGGDPVQLMKDRGYHYGLLLHGETISNSYAVVGLPTIYIVGIDGRIIYSGFGTNTALDTRRTEVIEDYLRKHDM